MSLNRGADRPPFTREDVEHGGAMVHLMALVIENARLQEEQARRIRELTALNRRLEEAQVQLMQSEKMAAIGQLAAGVAHEINNPVGYIRSNLGALGEYLQALLGLAGRAEEALGALPPEHPARRAWAEACAAADLDFLREDAPQLLAQCGEGVERVGRIVRDLKEFSHVDEAQWQEADLLQGLASTLNIVHNELKYRAEVVRELQPLPPVRCIPSQVNQVLMNLLVNAAQAMEEDRRGTITLRSGSEGPWVWLEVEDTGCGIPRERLGRIFDPFFTTKPVGKGTGLGLALSARIAQRHGGRIEVESTPGRGSRFRLWLPREGPPPEAEGEAEAAAPGARPVEA
ncbi:MAG: ATPase [Gammaproteobacteria bacterium]|nr:MAG: ATPase [Gammaproteobacteria bacterium]